MAANAKSLFHYDQSYETTILHCNLTGRNHYMTNISLIGSDPGIVFSPVHQEPEGGEGKKRDCCCVDRLCS